VVELEGEGLERLSFKIFSEGPRKTQYWTPGGVRRPEIWAPKEEDIPEELKVDHQPQREGISPRSA
jgi:hypothetical protein